MTIIITLVIATLLWRFYPIGKTDVLAFVCIAILVPTISEFIMMPIALFVGEVIIAGISVVSYNIILNTKDGFKMKCGPFYTFDESFIRRLFAFFMIHNKRNREKFSICAEKTVDGKRRFCLGMKNAESEFVKGNGFVECGTPLIPYMSVVFVFLVIL